MAMHVPEWKTRAAAKRASQAESIPKEWRLPESTEVPKDAYKFLKTSTLLTPEELEITETVDANILLRKLALGKISAVAVTTAFCKRAALAHQLIKCCTELFFDEAVETAKKLDDYLQKNGKTIGPLHGLPISLKDTFSISGQDTTLGWVSEIDKPAQHDDILVKVLKSQGAVLYVKTNIPQSLMMSDSYNHIFKQSVNAFHNGLVSGGSSGGEGALVGARGSIIGVGTDIGGSVRIPANLQGLYGLSPSVGRVAYEKSGSREYIVRGVAGPIATTLSSLETFMKGFLDGKPWEFDPTIIPIPWRRDVAAKPTRPLRIGFYLDDGVVRVQPDNELAVAKAIAALRGAGHDVFQWDTRDHQYAYDLWLKAVLADGGRRCQLLCEKGNQPLIEGMLVGTEKDRLSLEDSNALAQEIREYQKSYLQRWHDKQLDALIMPVQPWIGFAPKTWVKSSQYVGYSAQWNLLDFAALSMPVGLAKPHGIEDGKDVMPPWKEHKARNESDRFNWAQYDPTLIDGMPVSIQIVGGRYGEEKAVATAKVVEDALSKCSIPMGKRLPSS